MRLRILFDLHRDLSLPWQMQWPPPRGPDVRIVEATRYVSPRRHGSFPAAVTTAAEEEPTLAFNPVSYRALEQSSSTKERITPMCSKHHRPDDLHRDPQLLRDIDQCASLNFAVRLSSRPSSRAPNARLRFPYATSFSATRSSKRALSLRFGRSAIGRLRTYKARRSRL